MIVEPSEIFKVLSVETRVRIIELLKANGALGVKEISERLGITPPAVSQHLKTLKHAGLVRSERQGYWIPYSLNAEAMEGCRQIMNKVCTCRCQRVGKSKKRELAEANVELLKKYESELQKELELVREQLKNLATE